MELFDFTRTLINLESPTGNEHKVLNFLTHYLKDKGFHIDTQEVGEGRFNIYARVGEPVIVLSTHTDTVSPFIPYSEDKEFIYGRGACDAKGIIASQIKAAEKLLAENTQNFGLLFVVGEEGGSEGARTANSIPNNCRFLVNGEPTENKLGIGSKGALHVEVVTSGRSAHSAYPQQGESAILKLLDVLNDLRVLTLPKHDLLGETNFNIGKISGGNLANVIPDHASADFLFRTVTDNTHIKNLIEKAVQDRAELKYIFECDPIILETLDGFETTVVAFTTDIPLLNHWGKPFLLGPGSILDAHSPKERVAKKEIIRAVDIYCQIVKKLLRMNL